MQSNKESNQKLIERFPFLIPRNRWTGKVPEDYDYCLKEPEALYDYITGTLKPVPVSSGESTSQQE